MARKLRDEFDALARPSALDDVMREEDFLTRAERLFGLRERLWEAHDKRAREIQTKSTNISGKIGAAVGFLIFAAGGFGILGLGIFGLAAAAVLGVGGGYLGHAVADNPKNGNPKSLEALATRNWEAQHRIESRIDEMKGKALIQDIVVTDQFRKAFRAASRREAQPRPMSGC